MSKRNLLLIIFGVFLVISAVTVVCAWFFYFRFYESTDDAYVDGYRVEVRAQIPGKVVALFTDDTDLVKEGEVLLALDPTDYEVAWEEHKAELAWVAREVLNLKEAVQEAETTVALRKKEYEKLYQDFIDRERLIPILGVSYEDFRHARENMAIAKYQQELAEASLIQARITLGEGPLREHPKIREAVQTLRQSYINLQRTKIIAPLNGYVAKRMVQVGDQIDTTTILMYLVMLDNVWVNANFKETQIPEFRIGQPATVSFDMYGGRVSMEGKVVGIQPGTGAVFSLLPPQNATGNWIKIIQRVPVKIGLRSADIKRWPLPLGLSSYVTVDLHHTSGSILPKIADNKTVAETSVYDIDFSSFYKIVDAILMENGL